MQINLPVPALFVSHTHLFDRRIKIILNLVPRKSKGAWDHNLKSEPDQKV